MRLHTGGCPDTVRQFALEADSEKKEERKEKKKRSKKERKNKTKQKLAALESRTESVLRLSFRSDALPTELSTP